MTDIICAICGNNQHAKELYPSTLPTKKLSPSVYSARRSPDRLHYRMLRCEKCTLIFSSPIYPIEQITRLYKQSDCTYRDEIAYLQKTYFKLFEKIKSDVKKDDRILEIGCGNGFFLNFLAHKGYTNLFGIEPSKKMVNQAVKEIKKHIIIDIFRKNLFPKNYFKVIFIFHTLDHVVNLTEVITAMMNNLQKDGYIVVVVHDTEGLSVKLFGERSPIFDVEHIYLFNKNNLGKLFRKHRFLIKKIITLSNTYPLQYWIRMLPVHLSIKEKVIRLLSKFGLAAFPLAMKAGNIALIAKKTS